MSKQAELEEFLEKINSDLLTDPQKAQWENSDVSLWLMKLASEVNAISLALNESTTADIEDMAVSVATYAFIIAHLQNEKGVKKSKQKRKTKRKI